MANTYTLIASSTVGSGGVASITFGSGGTLSQTYTDLLLVFSVRTNAGGNEENIKITFNGVTGSSYSSKLLYGSGTGAASYSSSTTLEHQYANAAGSTSNTFASNQMYIPNYTSSNYKSVSVDSVTENNATAESMGLSAGIFNNSSPITELTIQPLSGANLIVQYSSAYLYGISNS